MSFSINLTDYIAECDKTINEISLDKERRMGLNRIKKYVKKEVVDSDSDSDCDSDFDFDDCCDICVKGWSKDNEFGFCVCWCYCGKYYSDCKAKCKEEECSMRNEIEEMGKEDKNILTETIPPDTRLCPLLETRLSLVKTEKLIYTSLLNPNSNKKIYKILLAKFDELMGLSYEIGSDLVVEGVITEGYYIEWCKDSLPLREYIRVCCSMGYGERL
jgi:hypothetical protein